MNCTKKVVVISPSLGKGYVGIVGDEPALMEYVLSGKIKHWLAY